LEASVLKFNPLKSKTFWGALLVSSSMLVNNGVNKATILKAVGTLITAVGVRDSVAKKDEK
jgi:hypothetical protein